MTLETTPRQPLAIEPSAALSYLVSIGAETGMASLKDEILTKLSAVAAPDGRPLTATGKL